MPAGALVLGSSDLCTTPAQLGNSSPGQEPGRSFYGGIEDKKLSRRQGGLGQKTEELSENPSTEG